MAGDVDICVTFKHCGHSHFFNDRLINVCEPVKIGRSTVKAKPSQDNLLFSCKVLSRNHALLWYENGQLFIRDTNSSNGTFVNNVRITEGVSKQLRNSDLLQFGVDVVEADKNVNHNCVIGTIEWPVDREAQLDNPALLGWKESIYVSTAPQTGANQDNVDISKKEFIRLSQYIKEALEREKVLKKKLSDVAQAVVVFQQSHKINLQGFIKEDYLLARIETLESELEIYSKNGSNDTLKQQLHNSHEAKYECELQLKDLLQKGLAEKLESNDDLAQVQIKYQDSLSELNRLQVLYNDTESELQTLRDQNAELKTFNKVLCLEVSNLKNDNEELSNKVSTLNHKCEETKGKLQFAEADVVALTGKVKLLQDNTEHEEYEGSTSDEQLENARKLKMTILKIKDSLQEVDEDIQSYFRTLVDSLDKNANHLHAFTIEDKNKLLKEKDELDSQITTLLNSEEKNKSVIADVEGKYRSQAAELLAKEKEMDLLKMSHDGELQSIKTELDAGRAKHKKAEDIIKSLEKSLREHTLSQKSLQEELAKLRKESLESKGAPLDSSMMYVFVAAVAVVLFILISFYSRKSS